MNHHLQPLRRITTHLAGLVLLALLLAVPAARAQFSMTPLAGFSPNGDGWFAPNEGGYPYLGALSAGDADRGLAYANGHLYLMSLTNVAGDFFHFRILDALTGNDLGALRKGTNIIAGTPTGGTALSRIACAEDGTIYICNITGTNNTSLFNVYKWAMEASYPELVWAGTSPSGARLGNSLAAIGSGAGTRLAVGVSGTPAVSNNNSYCIIDPTASNLTQVMFTGTPPFASDFSRAITFTDAAHVLGSQGNSRMRYTAWEGTVGTNLASPFIGATNQDAIGYAVIAGRPVVATYNTTNGVVTIMDFTTPSAPIVLGTGRAAVGTLATNFNRQANVLWADISGNTARLYAHGRNQGIQAFNVTIPPACPMFTSHPTSRLVCEGQPAQFTAAVLGDAPLFFQWLKGGVPIPGETNLTLNFAAVTPAHAGSYSLSVSNFCGVETSAAATLTVGPPGPEIHDQPISITTCPGRPASFSVSAHTHIGGTLSYQWRKNGNALPGATNATLAFASVTLIDAGQYDCEVTETGCGTTTSNPALLTVADAPPVVTMNGLPTITLEACTSTYIEPGATALDGCDGPLAVTIGGDVVNTSAPGTYFVTYRATDSSGQVTMATRSVIVQDTTPPVFTTAPANLTVACGDPNKQALINQWLASAAATDACGSATVTHTPVSTAACSSGTTVTWTATDARGLTSTTSATLTIAADRVLTGVQFQNNNLHLVVPANVTTQVVLMAVNNGACPTIFQSASVTGNGGSLGATVSPGSLPATVCPADFRTLTLNLDTTTAVPGTYPLLVTLAGPDGGQVVANVEVVVSGLALSDLTPNRPTGGISVTPASSPIQPLAGEAFTIGFKFFNIGATDAGAFSVRFFEGSTLLGVTNVASLAVNANTTVSLPVPGGRPDGVYLLRAEIIPPAIGEISVANNEASSLLRVGAFPTGSVGLVVHGVAIASCNNTNSVLINGAAEYQFGSGASLLTYPVKGGLVTFSNRVTGAVHPGGHTLVDGTFSASVPISFAGAYTVDVYVTDATLTGIKDTSFVVPPLNCPPEGGVVNQSGSPSPTFPTVARNLFICHDDIAVLQADCVTYAGPLVAIGQQVCVAANVHYYEQNARVSGPQPVYFTALQHSNGTVVPHFIGSTTVSFVGGGNAWVTMPWTPPVPGTYILQVRLNPTMAQTDADDVATKTLHVGPPGPTLIKTTAMGWNLCSSGAQRIEGHAVYTTPAVDLTIPNDAIAVICGDVIAQGYNQLGQLVGTRMAKTDLYGNFSFEPNLGMPYGSNHFVVTVTDGVLSGSTVIPFFCEPPQPNRPGRDTPPAATADVFTYSEDIGFHGSNCVNSLSRYPFTGESISISGNIRYYNSLNQPPPAGLPVDVSVLVPAGVSFLTQPLGTFTINNWLADNPICVPWTPSVAGPQIVQITARPDAIGLNQFTGNDAATRIIFVGDVRCWLDAVPAQQTILAGQSANVVGTATTLAGETPLLNLSVLYENAATMPPGMTVVALPPSIRAPGQAAVTVGTTVATPPGTYRFILAASGDGCHALAQFSVTVVDSVPPVLTLNGASSMTVECHGTFTDPGATALDNVDGDLTAGIQVSGTVNTNSPGTYTLTYSVTDAAGNTTTTTRTVVVQDTTPPTINCPPPVTSAANANCQSTIPDMRALATVNDLCSGANGVTVSQNPAAGTSVGLGTHTVTLTATDAAGNTASCTTTVTVVDQTPPTITCPAPSTVAANVNCSASLPSLVALATANDCNGTVTVTQSPAAGTTVGLGTHTVTLTATDAAGNSASCTTTVTVADQTPPVVTCPPAAQVSLGTNATVPLPDFAATTTATDCNGPITVSQSPAVGTAVGAGVHVITVTAIDAAGNSASCTTTFTVLAPSGNNPPVITSVVGPTAPVALGSAAALNVTFTDADGNQGHTLVVNWDDGLTTTNVVNPGTIPLTRTYPAPGVYGLTVTVTDAPGATATASYQFIVVYDPNGGFVTGGGWIQSPAGALAANPTASGRANFGFISKYQKGATVPTGQTQFQLHFASFSFESTSYEWLVVSGAKAQYKGRGMINNAGDYNFLLTATDGQVTGGGGVDKFRIKITDRATGALIYDNVPGASDDLEAANPLAISGGSIVIHKTK